MPKQTFSADYQPDKRRGPSRDKLGLLLEAIRDRFGDEKEFYEILLKRGMNPNDPAGPGLIREILARAFPHARPTMPFFQFDYRVDGTPSERLDDIAAAVAEGSLPVDAGKMMTDMIKASVEVREVTELAERLEKLEKLLNGKE